MSAHLPLQSATQLLATAVHAPLLAEGAPAAGGAPLMDLLPMILIFGVVYFIMIRPMSKQEKDRKARITGIKKGDQVVLSGGILGRVSSIDDAIAMVEVADKVKLKVLKKDISDLAENVLKSEKSSEVAKDAGAPAEKAGA